MQRKDEIVEAHGWASPDACIIYKGEVDSYGYGRVWTGEAKMQAHRYSLMQWQELDEAPEGMDAAHDPVLCTDRRCINPHHLRWATRSENLEDRWVAGTVGKAAPTIVRRYDCEDVRARVEAGETLEELAVELNVSTVELEKCVAIVF
jgi:hypothetical protein